MVLNGGKTVVAVILLMCVANASANPCAGKESGFVNDFSGCRNYFSCVATIAFPLECPLGFYFNELEQNCDMPGNVVCSRCPPTGITLTRNSNSCSEYTLCISGTAIDRECATGLYFNTDTSQCVLMKDVVCGINNCPSTGVAVVPNLVDCTKYLLCSEGTVVDELTCTSGFYFDRNTLQCVNAANCPAPV